MEWLIALDWFLNCTFHFGFQCKREGFVQQIKDEDGEGCNIEGSLEVNKVAGSFHFAPGKSFHQANIHMFNLLDFDRDYYNVRHISFFLEFVNILPKRVGPSISLIFFFLFSPIIYNSNSDAHPRVCTLSWMIQISHKVNRLAFGDYFPGAINPLDG